jgi:hypothetical protein
LCTSDTFCRPQSEFCISGHEYKLYGLCSFLPTSEIVAVLLTLSGATGAHILGKLARATGVYVWIEFVRQSSSVVPHVRRDTTEYTAAAYPLISWVSSLKLSGESR